jgi:hypothetical protein
MAQPIIDIWLLSNPYDSAAKLVEAGGKTNLSFAALVVL